MKQQSPCRFAPVTKLTSQTARTSSLHSMLIWIPPSLEMEGIQHTDRSEMVVFTVAQHHSPVGIFESFHIGLDLVGIGTVRLPSVSCDLYRQASRRPPGTICLYCIDAGSRFESSLLVIGSVCFSRPVSPPEARLWRTLRRSLTLELENEFSLSRLSVGGVAREAHQIFPLRRLRMGESR